MSDKSERISKTIGKSDDRRQQQQQQQSQSSKSLAMSSVAGHSSSKHSQSGGDSIRNRRQASTQPFRTITTKTVTKDGGASQFLSSSMHSSHLSDDDEIEVIDCDFDRLPFSAGASWPPGGGFNIAGGSNLDADDRDLPSFLRPTTSPIGSMSKTNTADCSVDRPLDGSNVAVIPSPSPVLTFDHQAISVGTETTTMARRPPPLRNDGGRGYKDNVHQPAAAEPDEASNMTTTSAATEPEPNKLSWEVQPHLQDVRDRLRFTLRYYFMSPFDKWNFRSRFPWKLVLQLLKIILVTSQALNIGHNFSRFQQIDHPIVMSMHNYFFQGWETSNEYNSVPPVSGPYAVYTKDDVFSHLDFAVRNFANIQNLSAGILGYQQPATATASVSSPLPMAPVDYCFRRLANASFNPSANAYHLDPTIVDKCYRLDNLHPPGAPAWANFSSADFLRANFSLEVDFAWLLELTLKLPLRGIILTESRIPACFDLDVWIHFNNQHHLGQIPVVLTHYTRELRCNGNIHAKTYYEANYAYSVTINVLSFMVCLMSMLLCIRSIYRSTLLCLRTRDFFLQAYGLRLDYGSQSHFVDGWILMTFVNDLTIIAGTILTLMNQNLLLGEINKGDQGHEMNAVRPQDYDHVGAGLLGTSAMLVWFCALRYLSYFSNYNILMVTFKHSIPALFRFLICAIIIFIGFSFGGWIILGPILFKFASLAGTAECLFALMNGDDVFATFAYLHKTNFWIWIFSRFYLYTFVLLFIYVILSIFIAILTDSYEQVKQYYRDPKHKHIKEFFDDDGMLASFMLDSMSPEEDERLLLALSNEIQWNDNNIYHSVSLRSAWSRARALFNFAQPWRTQFATSPADEPNNRIEGVNLIGSQSIN